MPSDEEEEESTRFRRSEPETWHPEHPLSLQEENKSSTSLVQPLENGEPSLRLMNLFDARNSQENSNASILVVDDNSYNMISIMTVLQQYQLETDLASDGNEAF